MQVMLIAISLGLLAACASNQPSIREVDAEAGNPDAEGTPRRQSVVAVEANLPTPTPVSQVSAIDGMEMVYVHPGQFIMGGRSNPWPSGIDPYADELPKHIVDLREYWIDKTEVSNRMYSLCQSAGACSLLDFQVLDTLAPGVAYLGPLYLDYPVVVVTWFQARDYCDWAGRRLPTEAEWEKAARGTSGQLYPWGNTEPGGRHLNVCDSRCAFVNREGNWPYATFDDGHPEIAPVMSFLTGASPYGALNLAGNVWEWVQDWYSKDYYATSSYEDPQGPATGNRRVMRGGGWSSPPKFARSSEREGGNPEGVRNTIGFRCAMSGAP